MLEMQLQNIQEINTIMHILNIKDTALHMHLLRKVNFL